MTKKKPTTGFTVVVHLTEREKHFFAAMLREMRREPTDATITAFVRWFAIEPIRVFLHAEQAARFLDDEPVEEWEGDEDEPIIT